MMMRRSIHVVLLLLAMLVAPLSTAAGAEPHDAVRDLTGAPTRVVWVQDTGDGSDTMAESDRMRVMAFDSEAGEAARAVTESPGNYVKPMISPSGEHVVFSSRDDWQAYVVNWDGADRRAIADGFALDVWVDPDTDIEWVYVKTAPKEYGYRASGDSTIRRYRLDEPGDGELVWDSTPIETDNFQLSADGKRASALAPWKKGGVVEFDNDRFSGQDAGCWVSLAPDNSYLFWIFDGAHRNVTIYDTSRGLRKDERHVNINNAPGIDGYEVYHPRWSNHARFLAMTGPYKEGGGGNRIGGGGRAVEVYIGRFNTDITAVEDWVQVTDNERGDFYPDVWIEPGRDAPSGLSDTRRRRLQDEPEPPSGDYKTWPAHTEDLVFLWENADATNQIVYPDGERGPTSRIQARGMARYGQFHEMILDNGAFVAEQSHDALRDACRQSGELTIEATLTANHLDQSGPARIVSFSSNTGSRNFTLGQDGNKLVFRLRTTQTSDNGLPQTELTEIEAGHTYHVIVSYRPGVLTCYVNGERVLASSRVHGGFENWSEQQLLFGDELSGDRAWAGRLEGIAIFSRAVGREEAAQRYKLYSARFEQREPAEQFDVEARLVEKSTIPTPDDIAPYRRGLVAHTYELERARDGEFETQRFQVAHWIILGGESLDRPFETGERYRLTLERFDDHPELRGERLSTDSNEFDLPMYFDARPVGD